MAHILIVDDDPDIRRLVTTILGDGEHTVTSAEDGQKALESLAQDVPDLVVLDVMMPLMDGFMVLKQMRVQGLRDSTRVLLLTARTAEADWVRGFKLGADGYLTKPFDPDELIGSVEELLNMSREQLKARREEELARAQMLSRLEAIFQG
jgi:DNA-binding response OmpR family regulator